MTERKRTIGPFGTLARVTVGSGLLLLAWLYFDAQWRDVVLGFAVLPAAVLLFMWLWLRYTSAPLRATGPLGHWVNCGIAAVLVLNPFTADAAALFYGASMLLAAVRGYAGCEILAISNTLLQRNDEVACPLFAPVDEIETRIAGKPGITA